MQVCDHPDRPIKAKGMCGSCYNRFLVNRDPAKKAEILSKRREQKQAKYAVRDKEAYSAAQKNRMLQHRYGIDMAEYQRLPVVQNNRCAICDAEGGNTRATRLYVDHNHTTGDVRQLLCPGCNQALGIVEQGVERIAALAQYLLKHDPASQAWNALARLDLLIRKNEAKQ